jgi:hypothetical protein
MSSSLAMMFRSVAGEDEILLAWVTDAELTGRP